MAKLAPFGGGGGGEAAGLTGGGLPAATGGGAGLLLRAGERCDEAEGWPGLLGLEGQG